MSIQCEIGKKYLITTNGWFYGPDGNDYRAVFGTVSGIKNDSETLGIKTDRGSANWFVVIGNMIVAGCQVQYCIQTDTYNKEPPMREINHNGVACASRSSLTRIYNADTGI